MEEAAKLFDMKVLHVGINATGEEQALGWAGEFLKFFDLPTKNGNSSVFAGTLVEIMKYAIACNRKTCKVLLEVNCKVTIQ